MDNLARAFRDRVKGELSKRDWSHQDLADKSGISRPQISNYLLGNNVPGLDKVERIAHALGVQPADLIRPEDPSIPEVKRELLALIRGMDENEAAWALEALDVLLRGLRGQPLRPDQPSKKVKDR